MDIRFLTDPLKMYSDDNHSTETSVSQVNTNLNGLKLF